MTGNEQLTALMREAGFLRGDASVGKKVFARAVSKHSARTYTHTYVTRWLNGVVPRDQQTRRAVAAALGERLGRGVALDEIGFAPAKNFPADLGLRYPDAPSDGINTLSQLWKADHDRVHDFLVAPANVGAWNEAALSWLVDTKNAGVVSGTDGRKVGAADIEGIRSTTELFDELDGRHGGGHARSSLIEFLRTDLVGLLRGSYTEETGKELFKTPHRRPFSAHGCPTTPGCTDLRSATSSMP
jgi:hypothetical protein